MSAAEKSFTDKGVELPKYLREQIKAIEDELGKEPVQLPYRALFTKRMIKRTITASAALMAMNLIVYTITTWTPTVLVMQGFDTQYSIFMTFIALLGAPFGIFLLSLFGNKHPRKIGMIVLLLILAVAGYIWSLQTQPMVLMIVGFILCTLVYYYAFSLARCIWAKHSQLKSAFVDQAFRMPWVVLRLSLLPPSSHRSSSPLALCQYMCSSESVW